jgi:S1-C subfamily serine protease
MPGFGRSPQESSLNAEEAMAIHTLGMRPKMPKRIGTATAWVAAAIVATAAMAPGSPARAQDLNEARRMRVAQRLQVSAALVIAGPSTGSGFVATGEGWVVTNAHVVQDWTGPLVVRFHDGTATQCRLIAMDQRRDLAILEPMGRLNVRPLRLGNSDRVQVGMTVLAYGSPFGLEGTLTQGIVSARRDLPGIGGGAVQGLIQTDAPINPGNSGGPLVNARGEVIGVNTAILSRTGGSHGIGFAVPANYVRDMIAATRRDIARRRQIARHVAPLPQPQPGVPGQVQLIPLPPPGGNAPLQQPQRVGPVWLGIMGDDFQGNGVAGVIVRQVIAGGPAQAAGILGAADPPPQAIRRLGVPWTGHIIVAVDGRPVRSMAELQAALSGRQPGEQATLAVTVGPGLVSGQTVVRLTQAPAQLQR